MGWSIHQKLSKHDKLLRKFVTVKYAKLTFASIAVFIAVLLLLNILLPRVHRLRRGWPYYSSKEPSRAFVLPLRFIVVFWAVALPYFLFAETRQDYLALVKRLGSVSVSMLPIVHFLALRPSPLPRMFYLQLLPLHKWLSRIFILIVIAHAILYFAIYVHLGKVRKLLITSNLCGLIACTLFIAIIFTSLKPIRRRFYNLFYSVHYFTAWVSLPLIYYHARITHAYVIIAACLLAAQACYRAFTSRHIKLPVQYISPSMFFISIPREQLPRTLQNTIRRARMCACLTHSITSAPGCSRRIRTLLHRYHRTRNSRLSSVRQHIQSNSAGFTRSQGLTARCPYLFLRMRRGGSSSEYSSWLVALVLHL